MAYPFRITIKFKESPESRDYSGEFEDAEADQLAAFLEAEEALRDAEYVKAGMPLEGKISWDEGTGFKDPNLPPATQVREFLHLLRPFLLQKEPANFEKIRKLLKRRYIDPDLRANLDLLLYSYSGEHTQSLFQIKAADVTLNSDEALDLWLNAYEFHRDADKRSKMELMAKGIPLGVQKVLFIDLLREKTQAIAWLGVFVRCALLSADNGHTVTLKAPKGAAT